MVFAVCKPWLRIVEAAHVRLGHTIKSAKFHLNLQQVWGTDSIITQIKKPSWGFRLNQIALSDIYRFRSVISPLVTSDHVKSSSGHVMDNDGRFSLAACGEGEREGVSPSWLSGWSWGTSDTEIIDWVSHRLFDFFDWPDNAIHFKSAHRILFLFNLVL